MPRLLLLSLVCLGLPASALASSLNIDSQGLIGAYYGLAHSEGSHTPQFANRGVARVDGQVSIGYDASAADSLRLVNDYTILFRTNDKIYRDGDWRYYPYLQWRNQDYGTFDLGYNYNVALLFHQGAKEITFLGIRDSNATYFLSNANWFNGKKRTYFYTPKSTAIMNDGRSAKLNYISPEFWRSRIGFTYTPDSANRRGMTSRYVDYDGRDDGYVFALQHYEYLWGGKLTLAAGFGLFESTTKETSFSAGYTNGGWNFGFGYKKAYVDGDKNAVSTTAVSSYLPAYFDNYRESSWDISLGYDFGRFKTNLAYLNSQADHTADRDQLLIQSNVFKLQYGLELYWMNVWLNSDGDTRLKHTDATGYAIISGIGWRF